MLQVPSGRKVTVKYATAGETATGGAACTGTTDFVNRSGTLTFAPGEQAKQVEVPVCGDARDEPNERFFVRLSAPTNATIVVGQRVGIITDDDP